MTRIEPPFRRVLVANRGEIAVRIIRACRELGMEAVAVYSDADADAAHVRMADAAVRLGPAPPAESYLRIDAIVDAARRDGRRGDPSRATASSRSARRSPARSRTRASSSSGPSSATIEALGDKLHARRLAARVDVPSVPGTLEPAPVDRPDQVDAIVATARGDRLPAAGQGGRGRRRPRDAPRRARGGPAGGARRPARREAAVGVRRRVGLPRARDPAGAPRRGAAARRRARHASSRWASATARCSGATRSSSRRRPRRACRRRSGDDAPRARRPARRGGRAAQRRDVRVPPRHRTDGSGSSRSTRGSRSSTA